MDGEHLADGTTLHPGFKSVYKNLDQAEMRVILLLPSREFIESNLASGCTFNGHPSLVEVVAGRNSKTDMKAPSVTLCGKPKGFIDR